MATIFLSNWASSGDYQCERDDPSVCDSLDSMAEPRVAGIHQDPSTVDAWLAAQRVAATADFEVDLEMAHEEWYADVPEDDVPGVLVPEESESYWTTTESIVAETGLRQWRMVLDYCGEEIGMVHVYEREL